MDMINQSATTQDQSKAMVNHGGSCIENGRRRTADAPTVKQGSKPTLSNGG
jgi:hypothetical protein